MLLLLNCIIIPANNDTSINVGLESIVRTNELVMKSLSKLLANSQNTTLSNSITNRPFVPKLQTQTQFHGDLNDKINIKSWLISIQKNMAFSQVTEKDLVICASIYLLGPALDHFNTWLQAKSAADMKNLNWDEFHQIMIDRFLPLDH